MDTVETLDQVLRLDPAARVLQHAGEWSTYGELAAQTDALRGALRREGVVPGAPVVAVLPNRPVGLVIMLAVLLERACLVPLSPRLPDQDRSKAPMGQVIVAPVGSLEGLRTVAGTGAALVAGSEVHESRPGVAVLMSTSGTTGEPRRVPVAYATIDGVIRGVRRQPDADVRLRDETTLICFPYTNLSGVLPQLIALVSGRRTALVERFDAALVAALVDEHQMRSLALNPTAMQMLLRAELGSDALASVRYVRSGSAPLSPTVAATFEDRFDVGVLQSYGQTEVGGEVVGWTVEDHHRHGRAKLGSVGRPHPGVQLVAVAQGCTPEDAALPAGEVGELWLRGARNVEGWHRLGDHGKVDADGFVWIEGRADDVIICGGFNIVPALVERVIEAHEAVREVAVVPRPDQRLGEVPVAVVVSQPGSELEEATLLEHCRQHLEPYQLPRAVVVVEALPRTDVGKVHRPSVRALVDSDGETTR